MNTALLAPRYKNDGQVVLVLNEVQKRARRDVMDKIDSGAYAFEQCACGVCGGDAFDVVAEKDRYGIPLSAAVCTACGLVQTNPRMDQRSYNEFYDSEYRRLYVGTEGPTRDFFTRQMNQGQLIAQFFAREHPVDWQDLKVLEVGCGAGGILKHLRDQGAQVRGCDLGSEYLAYGRDEYGLNLTHGPLSSLPEDDKFDVIIYSHVFEHVLTPYEELDEVALRLKPEGLLYLEIPGIHNIRSEYRSDFLRLLQHAHIFHFTLTTLNNMVARKGFRMVAGTEYVRSIYRQREGAVPEPVNDYPDVMRRLKRYERSRPIGRFLPAYLVRVAKLNLRRLAGKA
ncbi:MAG: class I SAM-dependent methyltransferase [Halioglobus sp.]|nr:class I SAM-dependent methyltransferase [Halioglobus sp.]